jgi:tetratricopeptide (TPR) repeat protein
VSDLRPVRHFARPIASMRGARPFVHVMLAVLLGLAPAVSSVRADGTLGQLECFAEGSSRRIEACTELLARGGLGDVERAAVLAQRALAYSLRARHREAIADYDGSLALVPDNATALNNRAWSYFKLGDPPRGLPDVERSLELSPSSPHALDTRAHIRQWLGQSAAALRDYRDAMQFGGERMIRLYQCGLQERGLYSGPLSGILTEELDAAMAQCVERPRCDPLPADEECRDSTS